MSVLNLCSLTGILIQKELALLSGVSERSLRRIERGQVNVNVYVLRQLVMALGEEMPDFWRIVEKNMELMGEEFPHVRKRVADKVLRDNKMDFIRRK